MGYDEGKHGTIFFDKARGFIEVRERYFDIHTKPLESIVKTGHFIEWLEDAKNNIDTGLKITIADLKEMVNVEEVGLKNIPEVTYVKGKYISGWKFKEKPKPEYTDITNECRTELRKSGHSEGYYSAIMHNTTLVAALGYGRLTPINIKKGYKVEKAKDATISFRVYKKSQK